MHFILAVLIWKIFPILGFFTDMPIFKTFDFTTIYEFGIFITSGDMH
jgi:hypothetical protein